MQCKESFFSRATGRYDLFSRVCDRHGHPDGRHGGDLSDPVCLGDRRRRGRTSGGGPVRSGGPSGPVSRVEGDLDDGSDGALSV